MKEKEYNNILLCNKWFIIFGMVWVKYSDYWYLNYILFGLIGSYLYFQRRKGEDEGKVCFLRI